VISRRNQGQGAEEFAAAQRADEGAERVRKILLKYDGSSRGRRKKRRAGRGEIKRHDRCLFIARGRNRSGNADASFVRRQAQREWLKKLDRRFCEFKREFSDIA